MSNLVIVNLDTRNPTLGYVTPSVNHPPQRVHSVPIAPQSAAHAASALGLTPTFVSALAGSRFSVWGVWGAVDALNTTIDVTMRLPSPPGTRKLTLRPVRHCLVPLRHSGAPTSHVHLVRIMFSTHTDPNRRTADVEWITPTTRQVQLRGQSPNTTPIALRGVTEASSHALVLVFSAEGLLMADACRVYWAMRGSSHAASLWAALPTLNTLLDDVYASLPPNWVDVRALNPTLPPSEAHQEPLTMDTVMQWFAQLPLTEAFAFLTQASEVYGLRHSSENPHDN